MLRSLLSLALVAGVLTAQQEQWTLRGRVVADESGRPLAGAVVTLTGYQPTGYPLHWVWLDWFDPEPITTGADGAFSFSLPPVPGRTPNDGYPARVHVVVTMPGRASVFSHWPLSRFFGGAVQDVGDLPLVPGREVRVRVLDPSGVAQHGRMVRIEQPGPSLPRMVGYATSRWHESLPSDASGIAVFDQPLPGGSGRITVVGDTIVKGDTVDVETGSLAPLEVDIVVKGEGRTVTGRLVDAGGEPLAGRELIAMYGNDGQQLTSRFRTAADGGFTIAGLPADVDAFQVRENEDDYDREPRWIPPFAIGPEPIRIEAVACGSLFVQVQMPAGVSADRFAVHVLPREKLPGSRVVRTVVRAPDGRLRIDGLGAGGHLVKVHACGTQLWPTKWIECTVPGDEQKPLAVALPAIVERTLFVFTADGRPVVDGAVEIACAPSSALTKVRMPDADGWWTLPVLRRTYTSPSEANRAPLIAVTDSARTDRAGRVRLRGLPTNDRVCVRVRGGGAIDSLVELDGWRDGKEVVRLEVPGAGVVQGVLRGPLAVASPIAATAQEVDDATAWGTGDDPWQRSLPALRRRCGSIVRLARIDGDAHGAVQRAIWDEQGRFRFDAVPPGRWEITVVDRERADDRVTDVERPGVAMQIDVVASEVREVVFEPKAPGPAKR